MLQQAPLHAYIPAKDVARARRFYEGKLGLKASLEFAGGVVYAGGARAAWFRDSEGNILAIVQSLDRPTPAGPTPGDE
jgi:predicted enzyme related to lactoylglutathione lyase